MDIPWQKLAPETLRALIEEFVTRDGTDYGTREVDLETKVARVHRLLEKGEVKIVFDADTETCDIRDSTEFRPRFGADQEAEVEDPSDGSGESSDPD